MDLRELPHRRSALHVLDPDQPLSLHLPRGTTLRVVSGAVWFTQEGLIQDVLLTPREPRDLEKQGHVVLDALGTSASVYVEMPAETRWSHVRLTPGLVSAIEADARRLRQQEISRMLNLAGKRLAWAVQALKRLLHRSLNVRNHSPMADK